MTRARGIALRAAVVAGALAIVTLVGAHVQAMVVVRTAVAFRPVVRAAAVVGTAAVTAAVVGSVVSTLPPQCVSTVVGGVAYQQCGATWYRPQYAGSQVNYVVVNAPH